MLISLIDYFSKQLSILKNNCWNFHKPGHLYQLISLISQYLLYWNDICQMTLRNGLGRLSLS